jgi:hypothetical protein
MGRNRIANRRKELLKKYGILYRRVKGFSLERCAYCDYPRACLDHVPPIMMLDEIDTKVYMEKGGTFLLYPSCNDCNRYLGYIKEIDFIDRLEHLAKKYNKKLDTREYWSDDEIKEMGHNMQSYIVGHQEKTRTLIKKLYAIENRIVGILNEEIINDKITI